MGMRQAPAWLVVLSSVFVVGLLALVVSSFLRASPEVYEPTIPRPAEVGEGVAQGRYTVDARDPDRWVFFDFSRGAVVEQPGSRDWDLAFRRFHVIVNGGPRFAGDGGARVVEEGVGSGPGPIELPGTGYVGTEGALGREPRHPLLDDWYDYGFLTHLLTPRPVVYAVRTADGRHAAIRFLGYYCPGARPGCVTFRWAYRGDGGRTLPSISASASTAR